MLVVEQPLQSHASVSSCSHPLPAPEAHILHELGVRLSVKAQRLSSRSHLAERSIAQEAVDFAPSGSHPQQQAFAEASQVCKEISV